MTTEEQILKIEELNQKIAQEPNNVDMYLELALIYADQKDYNKAIYNISQTIGLKSEWWKGYYIRAIIFTQYTDMPYQMFFAQQDIDVVDSIIWNYPCDISSEEREKCLRLNDYIKEEYRNSLTDNLIESPEGTIKPKKWQNPWENVFNILNRSILNYNKIISEVEYVAQLYKDMKMFYPVKYSYKQLYQDSVNNDGFFVFFLDIARFSYVLTNQENKIQTFLSYFDLEEKKLSVSYISFDSYTSMHNYDNSKKILDYILKQSSPLYFQYKKEMMFKFITNIIQDVSSFDDKEIPDLSSVFDQLIRTIQEELLYNSCIKSSEYQLVIDNFIELKDSIIDYAINPTTCVEKNERNDVFPSLPSDLFVNYVKNEIGSDILSNSLIDVNATKEQIGSINKLIFENGTLCYNLTRRNHVLEVLDVIKSSWKFITSRTIPNEVLKSLENVNLSVRGSINDGSLKFWFPSYPSLDDALTKSYVAIIRNTTNLIDYNCANFANAIHKSTQSTTTNSPKCSCMDWKHNADIYLNANNGYNIGSVLDLLNNLLVFRQTWLISKKEQEKRQLLIKTVSDYSHKICNSVIPNALHNLAIQISNSETFSKDEVVKILLKASKAEEEVQKQGKLLTIKIQQDYEAFRKMIKDSIKQSSLSQNEDAISIRDILSNSFETVLTTVLFNEDAVNQNIRKKIKTAVDGFNTVEIQKEFIKDVYIHKSLNSFEFLNKHIKKIEITTDENWEDVKFLKGGFAEILLSSHYREIFLNAFKYGDLTNYFLKISIGKDLNNTHFISFVNEITEKSKDIQNRIIGTKEGLGGVLGLDLKILNDSEDCFSYSDKDNLFTVMFKYKNILFNK